MYKIEDLQAEVVKPGIYFNMPDEVYHSDKSLSNSGMSYLFHTPKYGITVPTPRRYWCNSNLNPAKEPIDSYNFKMGRAFHTFVLEPEKFHDQFKIKPKVKTTTVTGYIGEGQYANLKNAAAELRANTTANTLLSAGFPEVAIFWVDEQTGVPCRIKVDVLGVRIAADLKTTSNAYDIGYAIVDYGYHRQVGFYLYGINKIKELINSGKDVVIKDCPDNSFLEEFLTTVHKNFSFIFQEKEAPYITRCVQLCPEAESNGLARSMDCLQLFKSQYELHGKNRWDTGLLNEIELISVSDLPQKINY